MVGAVEASPRTRPDRVRHWRDWPLVAGAVAAVLAQLAGVHLGWLSPAAALAGALLPIGILVMAGTAISARRGGRVPSGTLAERIFPLRTLDGTTITCVLRGDPTVTILPGDILRVDRSRETRRGLVVRQFTKLGAPAGPELARVRVRVPPRLLAVRCWRRAELLLVFLVICWTAYRLISGAFHG